MSLWVPVHGFQDKENLQDDVLNRPIYELVERTNFLFNSINDLKGLSTFETLRLTDVPLETTGPLAPAIQDFVYYNPVTRKYEKAQVTVSSLDDFTAGIQAFSLGMLTSKSVDTGTVVLHGKEPLATSASPWTMTDLLEDGETFRSGPYYLSAKEPGKITAFPSGLSIYLGYFTEGDTGLGDFVILSAQYKDLQESHRHMPFPLNGQPVGINDTTGTRPDDTHSILGFEVDGVIPGGDHIPRLVTTGQWTGVEDTTYTIWLSDSSSPTEVLGATSPPTAFGLATAFLHWESGDSAEGSGVVPVWAFDTAISVGTKGLVVYLENSFTTDWDEVYSVAADAEPLRTWTITVPTMTEGWESVKYRQYFGEDFVGTDGNYSLVLNGGPHTSDDNRTADTITVKTGKMYSVTYTGIPTAGDSITVAGTTYTEGVEFSLDITADGTYRNLLDAITGVAEVGVFAALDEDNSILMLLVPDVATVVNGLTLGTLAAETTSGVGDFGASSVDLLIYDENHDVLTSAGSFVDAIPYYERIALKNGLVLMPIPFDSDGTAATSDTTASGDTWDAELLAEAPGAYFRYTVGMNQRLAKFFPPTPVKAASLTLNGVEMDSFDHFPIDPSYRTGCDSIYWYPNFYGSVPWPHDWVDMSDEGNPAFRQNALFHMVKMSIGSTGVVTSIKPAAGAPIKFYECGTRIPASVGDLEADVELAFEEENANIPGYQVFKTVSGSKLRRGPVVEKIISPDNSIVVLSTAGAPAGQGIVALSTNTQTFSGDFEEVALENAKQDVIGMFPYIRLLDWETGGNNVPSGFIAKFRVPHSLGTAKYKARVYATVFGEEDIEYAQQSKFYAGLKFSYSILPDFLLPSGSPGFTANEEDAWNALGDNTLATGLIETTDPLVVSVPLGVVGGPITEPVYRAYDPMLIHNNIDIADTERRTAFVLGQSIPDPNVTNWTPSEEPYIRAGNLVAVRIERGDIGNTGPEYTSSLGIINLRWELQFVEL